MVNEKIPVEPFGEKNTTSVRPERDSRAVVLELLRSGNGVVPGERLGASAGISRVAVWKHVQALKSYGYAVTTTPKGYRLEQSPDPFSPYEFPMDSGIRFFETLDSTMEEALRSPGLPDGTLLLASRQTAGRGRLGRSWVSEPGGVYCTLVLKRPLPIRDCWRFGFSAVLAMKTALTRAAGIETEAKWPNDLLSGGKKIAGILSDIRGEAGMVTEAAIGIGVNVNNKELPDTGISVQALTGTPVSRKRIIGYFRDDFLRRVERSTDSELRSEWKASTTVLGKRVRVDTGCSVLSGFAVDLDGSGGLVLEDAHGNRSVAYYGDVLGMEQGTGGGI